MWRLITDKSERLCSARYHIKDMAEHYTASTSSSGGTSGSATTSGPSSSPFVFPQQQHHRHHQQHHEQLQHARDLAGHYVFPYDAEDIKAHKWFRDVPFDRLHQLPVPFV